MKPSEEKIIEQLLKKNFCPTTPQVVGIGDDAACLALEKEKTWVVSKDLFIEGTHFPKGAPYDWSAIGAKAILVNLSDMAAMGACPRFVFWGLGLPKDIQFQEVEQLITGAQKVLADYQVQLLGGDLVKSEEILISVTIMGEAPGQHVKLRSVAKESDVIATTGTLGASYLAFKEFQHRGKNLTSEFWRPRVRVHEGQWLGSRSEVRAMMDLSDGLIVDLQKLCKASGVHFQLSLDDHLLEQSFKQRCQNLGLDPWKSFLYGGEDFQLLFTVESSEWEKLKHEYYKEFQEELIQLGQIVSPSTALFVRCDSKEYPIEQASFQHWS